MPSKRFTLPAVAVILALVPIVEAHRGSADPAPSAVCGTWVLLEAASVTDLQNNRTRIDSALSLPGVVGLSLRFRWNVVDSDFALLEAGLAIAQARGRAFSVRAMAGRHTPARVFDAGSPFYVLGSGEKVPAPFAADGSPNLVFEAAYDEFVGRLAGWSRDHGVALLHLPWYGQDWAELNHGANVRAAAGYSLSAWTTAHERLIEIAARYSGADLAVELPLTGSGPLANGPSAALADHIVATAGAGSDRFYVQANGWGPNGEWGTTSATTEAQFDQIWSKPLRRGLQAIQPQDYDWTQLYASLAAVGADYAEVYVPSFSLARRDLLAAAIASFAANRCAAPDPPDTTPPEVAVAAPASGGVVAGSVVVSIQATDAGGPVSGIEVLVDGAVAGSSGAAPATIAWDSTTVPDGPHELTARASDGAGNVGTSPAVSVTVDNTAPAVPEGVTAVAGDGAVTVTFDAVTDADVAGYEARMKPSSSPTWAAPVGVASTTVDFTGLANGTAYDFAVRSLDGVGNASAWSVPVDATPVAEPRAPVVSITGPAGGARVAGTVDVVVEVVDEAGSVVLVELLVDGSPAGSTGGVPASFAWDTTTGSDGPHALSARAVDAGDLVGTSDAVSVTVDNTAPAVPEGVTAVAGDGAVTVTFDAVTDADVAGYEARMKPSSSPTWAAPVGVASTTVDFTGLAAGTAYDFAVRSLDGAGNASAWSVPVTATPFLSDGQPPDVSITAPADGARVAGTVMVAVEASDGGGTVTGVDLLVDGVPSGSAVAFPATIPWDTTTVADGPHVLSATASDPAGNAGLSATVAVTVDNTAPAVPTGLTPTAGDGQVAVTFAAVVVADLAGYELRMKPSSSPTWATPVPTTTTSEIFTDLVNGTSYDFAVRSLDTLGNASAWSPTASATPVAPDVLGPSVTVGAPTEGARVAGTVGVSMAAVDDRGVVDRVELLVDGILAGTATGAAATIAWDTRTVADGTHTVQGRAVDPAGNEGVSVPLTVTVDNTAPPVPGAVTATAGDRQVTVTFAPVAASDLAGYELRMKPSSSSTWGTPVSTTTTSRIFTGLVNGTSYDFAVRSRDTLGLLSAWSATVSATPRVPDTQAPTTPTGLTVTQRNQTSIQICWNASTDNVGVAGYRVSRNGTQVATTTSTCYLVTGLTRNTSYTLSVRAYDAAGNLSGTVSVTARTRN